MGKGKPRHMNENQQNKFCNRNYHINKNNEIVCSYYDSFVDDNGNIVCSAECMQPWMSQCKGDIFMCQKLKYKYLASLKEKHSI